MAYHSSGYDGNYSYSEYVIAHMLDSLYKLRIVSIDERIDACWFHGDYLDAARRFYEKQR